MDEKISADSFITDAVDTYSDTVYRIALNITRNPQDAYDVCQDVFVCLIKNLHKITGESHLKAWLIRVAINKAKSLLRRQHRDKIVSLEELQAEPSYTPQSGFELSEAVRSLPEKYSTVIYLFYYEDMKIADIAEAVGASQSAVKLRLSRAREKLRNLLEKESYND